MTTCRPKCFILTQEAWEEVDQLNSSQEEADTRMFLNADHVAKSGRYQAIVITADDTDVITADDTDVLVLSLGLRESISVPMYQKSGTAKRHAFTDISAVADSIGIGICKAISSFHVFTGCDSTSAFAGRGKSGNVCPDRH